MNSLFAVSKRQNTMPVFVVPFPLPRVHVAIFIEIRSFSVSDTKKCLSVVTHYTFKISPFSRDAQAHL